MYSQNLHRKGRGGLANDEKADKEGRGFGEILTMADKGGRGGWGNAVSG